MRFQFLIVLILLSVLKLDAQVYAIGIGAGPNRPLTILRVDEHRWLIGSFGLVQFRARSGEGTPWIRQTTVHLGTSSFTTRRPAASIALLGAASMGLLVLLIAGTNRGLRRSSSPAAASITDYFHY